LVVRLVLQSATPVHCNLCSAAMSSLLVNLLLANLSPQLSLWLLRRSVASIEYLASSLRVLFVNALRKDYKSYPATARRSCKPCGRIDIRLNVANTFALVVFFGGAPFFCHTRAYGPLCPIVGGEVAQPQPLRATRTAIPRIIVYQTPMHMGSTSRYEYEWSLY